MKDIEAIPLDDLAEISGGLTRSEEQIRFRSVKCPVAGCDFTCSTFGDMNVHMRNCHPERFGR